MDGVSVREFANHIGKSHVWVLKLIEKGAIPRNDDGTIPLEAGLRAYKEFLAAPKNPRGRPSKASIKEKAVPVVKEKQKKKPKQRAKATTHIPLELYEAEKDRKSEEAVNINTAMKKAKLAQTTYQARLRELEYKLKAGELLEKTAVAEEAQQLASQVKSKLLAIPPRISSMCEGRIARDIEEIITDAINQALAELQKCKYTNEEK